MKKMLPIFSLDKAAELHGEFVRDFWPIIGTANQTCIRWFLETYDQLEEQGMLQRDIKRHCNECNKSIETYQRYVRNSLGDRFAVWSDITNVATHNLYPDVVRLYFSVKSAIDKHETRSDSKAIPSDLRAKVFVAHTFAQITVGMYDSLRDLYQHQTIYNIQKDFKDARFGAVMHHLGALTKFFAQTKGVVDLNEDDNCKLGVKVILKRFETKDFINEAISDAIHQNPNIYDSLSDEEKDIIDNGPKKKDTTKSESQTKE